MKIKIIQGDITKISCDVIVNPTDRKLSGGGGVDRAIQEAAGEQYRIEKCQMLSNPLFDPQKATWVSSGGNLPASHIVHICAPRWKDGTKGEKKELEMCYRSALDAAESVKSNAVSHLGRVVAFPDIATGTNGFPVEEAAKIALSTVNRFLFEQTHRKIDTVLFVCSEEKYQVYERVYNWIFGEGIPAEERIRGAMLGGAIGDAMGYPVEFIRKNIPMVKDYQLKDGKALISDDTQMMMFTACGVMFAHTRAMTHGVAGNIWNYIKIAYEEWLNTQKMMFNRNAIERERWGRRVSWISYIPELYSRRAPGITCMSALEESKNGRTISSADPVNNSKGCGGVMRIAPIPLYMAARHIGDKKYVVKTCCEAAALTHGHPLGWLSAGAFGCLLYDIMENFSLHYAVEDTANFMKEHYGNHPDTARLIELLNAAKYAADIRGHHSNYYTMCEPECECLGEGWVGEEALAIGLYCAMAAVGMGFENCILNSVTHKGDSDSTGLIAGNIFGAYFGDHVIPEKWLKPLEFRSVLEELSADMAQGCRIAEDENYHDLAWEKKYVECVPYQRDPEREPMIFKTYLYGEPGCGIHEIEMPHTTPVSKADGSVEFVKTTVKHYLKEESVWQEGESQRDGWVKFEKTQFGMDISGWYKWFSFHLVYDPCYQKIYILNSDMAERGGNPWIGEISRNRMEVGSPIQIILTENILPAVELMILSEQFPYRI